jgi:hypothetical protein
MRPSIWILGVGLGMLLAVLIGCGPSNSSSKSSQTSEKKTDDKMPTPPKSDPG